MSNEKRKRTQITTPKGIAVWPRLETPDTKYVKEGLYSVSLRMKEEDAKPIIEACKAAIQAEVEAQAIKQKKKAVQIKRSPTGLPVKRVTEVVTDPVTKVETEVPTGEVEIKASLKAHVATKAGKEWDQKPRIFDAKGKPLIKTRIGGGSTLKLNCELNPYWVAAHGVGVSLWVRGVQVLDYKEYNPEDRSAEEFGFTSEEGYSNEGLDGGGDAPAGESTGEGEASGEGAAEGTEAPTEGGLRDF